MHLIFTYISLFVLSLYNVNAFQAVGWPKLNSQKLGFSWQNCGPSSDPLQVKSLAVTPDPVDIPGNITINVNFTVASAVPTDLRISLVMEKKVGGFYVKVPCIDNIGSCNYGGICEDWAKACPKYFEKYGIPCQCPIAANTYSVPGAVIGITATLPSIITGDFRVTGDFGSDSGHLGCLRLDLTLKS